MVKANKKNRVKTVWRFGKKYVPLFIIAEICILVSYAISVILPLNLKRLTDQVLYGGKYDLLPGVIKSYFVLFATAAVFNMLYAFVWQYLNNHYIVDIKNEMFQKTIFAKAAFLSDMNSGDIMSRIDGDSEQFIHVIQRNLFHFVNSMLLCISVIWMIAGINLWIAVMLTGAALLPIALTRFCGRFTEKYSKEVREINGSMTGRLYELLKGLREVRLAAASRWMNAQVLTPLKKLIALGNRIRRIDFFVNKAIYLINLSASIVIYGFSAHLIIKGELTIGLFLAVIEYIALLHKKFNWMLRIYLDWFGRKVSIDRVNEVLNQAGEAKDGVEISEIGNIRFENVSFAYDDNNQVFEHVSFAISKGEKVGFVGTSGVGKTTLISLLLGFYQPVGGEIFINDIPIKEINPASLRKLIGVVSQDILLFDESVRYNLNLGNAYGEEEIWNALDAVDLKELVQELPQGLDTEISAAAHNLSGGQKQRLMIARLLLKKPELIVLDEATSALDVETEEKIADRLTALHEDAALIVISHRFAALKGCGRLYVLHEHGIAGAGRHEELLRESKIYREMFGGEAV